MSDPKVEALRSSINKFRRTRRTQTEPFPIVIRTEVVGLINSDRSIPEVSKLVGISSVLIYQWRKAVRKRKPSLDHDPFIELPVESVVDHAKGLLPQSSLGVVEIRRDDLSAVLRIECSTESIAALMKDFLGRAPIC
jgi:transposase-like protein